MMQVPVPAGIYGHAMITITPRPNVLGYWSSYASSVDNRTGDGWISQATRPFNRP